MRHLLNYKYSSNRFATIREMIKKKTRQIKQFDKNHGVQFQQHLKNLVLGTKEKEKATKKVSNTYEKICLSAAKPVETLLTQFLDKSKKYTEEQLTQTTVYLGKAYQLSLMDHGGHLDRFGHKLLESPMFDHFIEQVKYALSDRVYIENKNIVKVLDGLSQMNYVDYDIVRLVIQKIQKILELKQEERIKFQPRYYQSQKKNYYKTNIIGLDKALIQNKKFQKNIAYFEEKKKQYTKRQTFTNMQKQDFENKEIYQDIVQLLNQFDKFNKSADKLLEGIIAVRRQYRKMVTIAAGQKVMRNPQLNSATLEVQQKLLQMHLITFQDIKNPQYIQKQREKVQKILRYYMSEAHVENFQDFFIQQQPNLDYLKQRKQKQLLEFSALLESLAKYVNLPFRLYGSDDNVSLLNVKWQRFMLENKFKENNLNVQRMFRRAFVETQMFISRNLTILQLSFIEASLKSKVRWYSCLIQMGFIQGVYYQFKSLNLKPENLEDLNQQQIFHFARIMNNSYQKQFVPNEIIHHYLQARLLKILDEETYAPTIGQLCEAINYLYQASYNQKWKLHQTLYSRLIERISQQVQYIDQSSGCNKRFATQAKRILYFQGPQGSQYTGSIQKLSEIQQLKNQKSNPYLKVLFQSLKSTSGNQMFVTPYITTGVNDNNEISGIYIANSDNSSFEGQFVTGNINAYCARLHKKFGIKITPVPLSKFMDIKFPSKYTDRVSKDIVMQLKNSQEILAAFTPYLKRNNQILTDFIKNISRQITQGAQQNDVKTRKIVSTLMKIAQFYNSQKQVLLIDQFYVKRCQLLVQFNLLKRDLQLLTKQQKQQLQRKLNLNQSQKDKNLEALVARVQKQIQKPITRIQQRFKQISQNNKNNKQVSFKGKRITMNLLQESNNADTNVIENIQQQLISVPYLLDSRYVQYEDWRNKLKNTVNFNQIKLENASDLTKFLTMRFCPHAKDTIVALPQKSGQLFVPFYPLNWQQKYYYHSQNTQQKNNLEQVAQSYRQAHINVKQGKQKIDVNMVILQNYKHQLKANKSPTQILDMITRLQFIDQIMLNKLSPQNQNKTQTQPQFIERNAQQYFNYLQRKSDKLYLESPYLQYIFNKIQQSQAMKQKIQQRKQNKIKLQMLYNQGVINRKQYFDNVKQVDLKLIQDMKKMKKKVLTHIDGVQILEDGSKIVQLNHNIEELQRIVHAGNWYDKNQDEDLVLAQGNFEQALKIKRAKAQNNLILFKIIALKASNKPITQQQKKFIQNWKKSVHSGINSYSLNNSYTNLKLKQLKSKDIDILYTPNTNIVKHCSNLALNDLILQISHFFDETVINRLQSQIYSEYFGQKYNVPSQIFASTSNKVFKSLAYKAEDAIFQKNSQLNQRQLDCLIEMSKIFKTEALSDREKYNIYYKTLKQDLNLINNCRYRNPLSIQYLKQKDYQYYNNYNPKQITQIKQKQSSNLWLKIFQKQQSKTSPTQIRSKVSQICKRMLFIKINIPPYFGNLILKILKNQKIDTYTKQKLIAYVQLFKVQLKLDSQDLLGLVQTQKIQFDKIMGEMKKYNEGNFIKKVYNCL